MIGFATYLAIYAIVWWVCLFMVLPFGVRNQVDAGEIVPGSEPGAPVNPKWAKRLLVTTVVSVPATAVLFWLLSNPGLQEYWS